MPYIFAFNNAMLFINTTPLDVVLVIITSTIGMLLIALGMVGYFLRDANMILRLVCIAGGLLLIYPGTVTDLIGLGVLVAIFLLQKAQNAKDKKATV